MMLMDSGVVCDGTLLHWGNLLKVYTHSKTCKPRMSGILFRLETVNLRYVLSLYVNFTPQYKISGETFMVTQNAWLEAVYCLN